MKKLLRFFIPCDTIKERRWLSWIAKKYVSLRLDEDMHQRLKIITVIEKTTIQDYIINLILADMDRKERANEKER